MNITIGFVMTKYSGIGWPVGKINKSLFPHPPTTMEIVSLVDKTCSRIQLTTCMHRCLLKMGLGQKFSIVAVCYVHQGDTKH
jgi:hypothetical protein